MSYKRRYTYEEQAAWVQRNLPGEPVVFAIRAGRALRDTRREVNAQAIYEYMKATRCSAEDFGEAA